MKRLFQKTPSTSALSRGSSKGSSPSSPDSIGEQHGSPNRRSSRGERRSYSPEKLAAVFRRTSPDKRAAQASLQDEADGARTLPRAASTSISDAELHGKVVEYMTAASEAAQDAALREIHTAILEDVAATGVRMRVSQKDTDKLISVSSQRLRLAFQRRLDAFNAALLKTPDQPALSFLGESDDVVDHFVVALDVLTELLQDSEANATNHVVLVVSERLPSTLVKVLKACSRSGGAQLTPDDARVADAVFKVLTRLVHFQETVHELAEASTLHRLFHLRFASRERQLATLHLIEASVESTRGTLWNGVLTHLQEHRGLQELLASVETAESLAKVLSICARVLRAAYERNDLTLHRQLRLDQYYADAFTMFQATFQGGDGEERNGPQEALRIAIAELCLSGSESALVVADVTHDPCFALCENKAPAKASFFNVEAFSIVGHILDFLHEHCDGSSLAASCERLACLYIQKIGRLIAANRFDYVLIRRSGIMEQLLRRLNKLPDLSKHAVGSVLAATAIEAGVIPYSELTTIAVYIGHTTTQASSNNRSTGLMVLLGFVVNLLRFHRAYRSIFRSTGVIEAIVSLFQAQTVLVSSDEVASTKINVAYPTSQLKIGHSSWHRRHSPGAAASDWVLPVNEKNLVLFLTSHCRQTSAVRKGDPSHHCVDHRVFVLVLDVLTAFADQSANSSDSDGGNNAEEDDEEAVRVGLCEPPVLECICILLANEHYQESALLLWTAVIQIALRIKKQNTSAYNTVNCFLQSLRYAGLSLYYKKDQDVKIMVHAPIEVLCTGLGFLEATLRPEPPGADLCRRGSTAAVKLASKVDRDRLLLAVVDSGGLYTCLALCCALACAMEPNGGQQSDRPNYDSSDKAFILSTRLLQILVTSNASVAELFNCAVTFDFYGSLHHQYVLQRTGNIQKSDGESKDHSVDMLCGSLLQGLLGFAVYDYEIALRDGGCDTLMVETNKVTQPGALVVLMQLLRLWSRDVLSAQHTDRVLRHVGDLLEIPENARACAPANLSDVLLATFATLGNPASIVSEVEAEESLSTSLLDQKNRYHPILLKMLESAVAGGISHILAGRWIKLIVGASVELRNGTLKKQEDQSESPVTPLLRVLVKLAVGNCSTSSCGQNPAIMFDSSRDGFAQMQIPEVLARASGLSSSFHVAGQTVVVPASSSASSSAFAALTAKVWPPPDGYTAMVWFRIDAVETKDAREKHYWDLLMQSLCVLCHKTTKDETALKCSHRACRACLEALTNCGGECVVCNPPTFYLFRFRSGDTKCVSELFLRGPKLCMRTSAASKTGIHPFNHAPLQVGRWYHAAVVHSRQRFQSSHVSLYLNGVLQETAKVSYPSSISSGQPLSGLVGIPSQARRLAATQWTIGSFYLLEDALSAHLVNAAFAVGPSYGGLFAGPSGSNELLVCVDHLSVESLLLLDEYTRDPIKTLIESVEAAERSGKNSILRSSLSLASAASSAAAAIVQDIKTRGTSASIFGRIASAVPVVSIPLSHDRITLVYSSSTAVGVDLSVIPNGKLDGRPLAQLMGGAEIRASFRLADMLHDLCGSGARFVYMLIESTTGALELECTLELLWQTLHCHPKNLAAMEHEHGYGIVNYLLHQKAGSMLTIKTLMLLFRIVGVDIDDDSASMHDSPAERRESAIRNLLALQHFVLDYSLWQHASTSIQKLLFSTLYASMMTGGDDAEAVTRERNRAQLQSLSIVRQLLYVFLDPDVDNDLLRVIADLILVCLTAGNRTGSSHVEANFSEIASFLASSLSPRFARTRDVFEEPGNKPRATVHSPDSPQRPSPARRRFDVFVDVSSDSQSPVQRLCLSPRGNARRFGGTEAMEWRRSDPHLPSPASTPVSPKGPSSLPLFSSSAPTIRVRQTQVQDMLLDILTKAVHKHDLKENRERDEVEGLYVETGLDGSARPMPATTTPSSTPSQRLQMPTTATVAKLAGFRKVLSPRWIGFFLFPAGDASCSSVMIAPSTVVAALKLLAALLNRARYESVFRKDGYYRLLAQGLPCDHRAVSGSFSSTSSFPFDHMWYSLFCMVLGPPVDGLPHEIHFDMFFLTKDFALNVERDRLVNAHIAWVILALVRRHYNDPIAFEALRRLRISPETSMMTQVAHALYANPPADAALCHAPVLDFLAHIYSSMPAFRNLLVHSHGSGSTTGNIHTSSQHTSGSGAESKLRGEVLDELSLLACGAARAELFVKYAPSEKRVHQALLNQKRDLTAIEFAACTVEITEHSALEDANGDDPFLHPIAGRAIKMLVAILCDFLVMHPKGADHVEAFFDSHSGSALSPPLHDGLQLRFQTLVLIGLVERVRIQLADDSILSDHKAFATNIKEFMALAIQKMHMWQRAQHGDACPQAFACCGETFHFAGGPLVLLDLALYFLGDTTAGATTSTSSASSSSSTSSLGQMIQDKLNKSAKHSKRRQTLKSLLLGKVAFGASSKSAELEALASAMYAAVNAVVLHVLQGHGSEVSDDECETLLQLVHVHRDVVLNARNTQDREFLICLCRFLLQLLAAGGEGSASSASVGESGKALQEIAAQIWIDLLQLQRPLMVELLTVELRRAGGAPYVVNLMKNGFDVLLECPRMDTETSIVESAAFKKFKGWLDIVGPPLSELETTLDRVFVRRMVEAKEDVRDAWTMSHKRQAQRSAKEAKRFASRFEWFGNMERTRFDALVDTQQNEFRRQLKWRQDRIDRHKFHSRQWQKLRHDLLQQALRDSDDDEKEDSVLNAHPLRSLTLEIAQQHRRQRAIATKKHCISWLLDATEGPSRMRKRLIAKVHSEGPAIPAKSVTPPISSFTARTESLVHRRSLTSLEPYPTRHRRFSESDIEWYAHTLEKIDPIVHAASNPPDQIQLRRLKKDVSQEKPKSRPASRRLSFENVLRAMPLDSDAEICRAGDLYRQRQDSSLSTTNDQGSGDDDDQDQEDSIANEGGRSGFGDDDKNDADAVDEKLRPLLVPGDEILDMFDCLRVDGMDACPGVFILCSDHLYIVDNYQLIVKYGPTLPVESAAALSRRGPLGSSWKDISAAAATAKVMEVSVEAPTRLERRLSLRFQVPSPAFEAPQTPSGVLTMQRSTFTHQCRFWAYEDVVELHKRRHQLRHVALELFAHDGRNYLITFESPQQRESVFNSLLAKCPNVRGAANGMDGTTTVSGDLYSQLKKLLRQNMTERWISREISNFEYLMHLNTLAGRSYNDLTQYPVFPWVLSDYTSTTLDLTDPGVYRDLSKPMGALYREDEFRARYESLVGDGGAGDDDDGDDPMGVKPFHYGTHYSSAGIVLHYLMRIEPFTTHFIRLQGGKFDHADRLFSSVASAWKSAAGMDSAHNGTQDVKELTPEFYYLPSFLTNLNHHEFGRDQNGFAVDDVELPPWAHGSPREFVRVNREALESPFVSAHLHHWIDLIFGVKQQGPAAIEACNVFYHLTYEGAVDLDAITDLAMRRAMVDQISEFGQTPSQLFKTPHPPRLRLSTATGLPSSSSSFGSSGGPTSSGSASASATTTDNSTGAATVGSPLPASSGLSLASSFIEGSDLMGRMHSMLSNTSATSASLLDDSTAILDHAAMLQQEPRREVGVNSLVAAHRGHHQQQSSSFPGNGFAPSMTMRTRQLSSGVLAAPIHQIAIASASVTRDERVACVGDRCLLIPPRHHEFFAWGFQDRSLKILSTSSSEVAHGGDSKVVASFEIEFPISVACMTSDGRTLIAGGAVAPVVRLWQFSATKKSVVSSVAGGGASVGTRKRAYSVGLHSAGAGGRSLVSLATLSTPSHRAPITAVQVCRAYSVIVSGCAGGAAVLWDLNRLRYSRTLATPSEDDTNVREPIRAIAINEVTGDLVVACGAVFTVYDVNGELLARLRAETLLHDSQYPRGAITSMAVNRSEASAWCREKAVVTGHADGVLCIWAYAHNGYGDGDVAIELKGRHMVSKTLATSSATTSRSAITSVLLATDERRLFTGNADGLLSLWTPLAPSGGAPTTPTKSVAASASPLSTQPTSLL